MDVTAQELRELELGVTKEKETTEPQQAARRSGQQRGKEKNTQNGISRTGKCNENVKSVRTKTVTKIEATA